MVDEVRDLALLKPPLTNTDYVYLSSSYFVHSGDSVYTYGSPLGISNTITEGIVSNNSINYYGLEYIQISAPISPGSSGGMLVNEYGDVIGITTAYLVDGQNMNLAIPINRVIKLINEIDQDVNIYDPGNSHLVNITESTINKISTYLYSNETDEFFGFLDSFHLFRVIFCATIVLSLKDLLYQQK